MNPLIVKLFKGIVRALIAGYAADLIAPEQQEAVAQAVAVALAGMWSMFDHWREQQKLVTALASPVKMSEAAVSEKIASGLAAPVMTASQDVPVIIASR